MVGPGDYRLRPHCTVGAAAWDYQCLVDRVRPGSGRAPRKAVRSPAKDVTFAEACTGLGRGNRLPRTELLRQVPPGDSAPVPVCDTVLDLAVVP